MADREYRIKIITVADNAGASAAASGLRDVTNAAGDSGKAQEKAGEAAEGHHKSLLHAESGAKQLHQTLHLLTEQAPLLGLAMEAAITPVGAALAAAAVAFHTISKNLEELNKQLDEMADSAAKPLTNIHESVKRATASIKEMNQEYSEFIRNSKEAAGLSKEGLDSDSQALEAQSEQLRENLKLQTDLEKLRIEQSNSLPAQKAAALAALDANSQDAERALGAQQREKQLALDQAALD